MSAYWNHVFPAGISAQIPEPPACSGFMSVNPISLDPSVSSPIPETTSPDPPQATAAERAPATVSGLSSIKNADGQWQEKRHHNTAQAARRLISSLGFVLDPVIPDTLCPLADAGHLARPRFAWRLFRTHGVNGCSFLGAINSLVSVGCGFIVGIYGRLDDRRRRRH